MGSLNNIKISKKILDFAKKKRNGFTRKSVFIFLELHEINVSIYFVRNFLDFLVKTNALTLKKTGRNYTYFFCEFNDFFSSDYLTRKEFAEKASISLSTISYKIINKKIKNFMKIGKKYFIHKSELENQGSL